MKSAMDREFYDEKYDNRPERRADTVQAVQLSMDRVAQLHAVLDLVTDESKAELREELDAERSFLRANINWLKEVLEDQPSRYPRLRPGETKLIDAAEKVLRTSALVRQSGAEDDCLKLPP